MERWSWRWHLDRRGGAGGGMEVELRRSWMEDGGGVAWPIKRERN